MERTRWLKIKERGKLRLILSQVLKNLAMVTVVVIGIRVFGASGSPLSAALIIYSSIFLVPLLVLGGYLQGNWKWKEMEKKFPG